jgi:uncharacterized protein with von Willebrand factor type A (vWA) domain
MPSIRAALYRELYQFFTSERHGARPSTASGRDLPHPLARGLVHFYSLLRTATLDALTDSLADLVASTVSEWFAALWGDLDSPGVGATPGRHPGGKAMDGPGADGPGADGPGADGPGADASVEELLEWYRNHRGGDDAFLHRVDRRLSAAVLPEEHAAIHREAHLAVQRLRRERWETSRERAIRLVVTPLADHLNEVIPPIATADERCRKIFRRPGTWEIFGDSWRDISWRAISAANDVLDRDAEMQRLTEAIVRGPLVDEKRTLRRQEERRISRRELFDRGYGAVTGMRGQGGVELALPNELALLATPETEDLFSRKLADQGILALANDRVGVRESVHTVLEWREVAVPVHLGPVFVCLDTSGSMEGIAESVAGAVLLGLVRASLPHHRRIEIIVMQGGLRQVAIPSRVDDDVIPPGPPGDAPDADAAPIPASLAGLSPSRVDERVIRALNQLLDRPTASGSDVDPALEVALEAISGLERTVADLVIISDMRFPRIGPHHRSRLAELQRAGVVRSHAVTIGEKPMHDPLNTFDQLLHYNTRPDETARISGEAALIGFRHADRLFQPSFR